ncbi:NAD(P)/FAD-dependent oxidoreductase [Yinghuangia sp. YIM S10712]|uniref:NAD(P)/FAD-dependent oxidoreductase n=1 Tax=Yinghuangia sp. YIM S10712 TaxID=3436930 RepID=UPI003F53CB18
MAEIRDIVVVGGGAAGVAAVETLRRDGYTGSLTLLCGESALPYDRPPLSKQVLTGAWELEKTLLRDEQQYRDLDVPLRHVAATGLDVAGRRVRLADGGELAYDGLVIATGVHPRRLPIGHDLAGVHVLRGHTDAEGLRGALVPGTRLVVVGAGLIGLEVAASARGLGLNVTVVEPAALPMLRQVGSQIGAIIADMHREEGVDLRLGVGVDAIRGDGGKVDAVVLSDGNVLDADCVLVSIGAEPTVDWLRDSELTIGNGIECDEFCRAAPGVYAAGDVASWVNPRYGRRMRLEHRTNASEQGGAAAQNLLQDLAGGERKPFAPLPYFWTDQYKVKIQAHGVLAEGSDIEIVPGPAEGRWAAVYRTDGQVTGVLGWNAPTMVLPYRKQMLEQAMAR